MNEREKLMYSIISNISRTEAPLIFKGALITKLILKENGFKQIYDRLKGIEGKPDFENLYTYLSKFFKPFAKREYIERIWDSDKASWNELKE
ncbi:MAG: hypothetical protein KGZ33_05830 [Alkaliphilus sp.]|nr:hypothetical protein [Alkaliphilus sp.]